MVLRHSRILDECARENKILTVVVEMVLVPRFLGANAHTVITVVVEVICTAPLLGQRNLGSQWYLGLMQCTEVETAQLDLLRGYVIS